MPDPGPARRSGLYLSVLEGIGPAGRTQRARDVVAGVTLAALAIPEVMGYTRISGTPVVSGLYTILLPAVAFALLGSSRHLVVGGDSATAAMLYAGIASLGIAELAPGSDEWLALAGIAALITGGLLLLARVARLGFVAEFISRTVLVGFLTGVGIQVALSQLPGMLGVPSPDVAPDRASGTVIAFWRTLDELSQVQAATLAVAVAVILVLVVFERWVTRVPGGLVAVVGAIVASWALDLGSRGVAVLGPVPGGFPPLGLPSGVGWDEARALFPVCGSMLLVILAQSAATSRAYAVRYRERFDENTDLVGLGIANIAAAFSSAFVVNGSPTKTEMADAAKGRSQIAMLAMAATTAVVLLFLTEPLQYLPDAALSAVVFVIGLKLVDVRGMRAIARVRRGEFYLAAATAAVVVGVGVEQGIVVAIVLSLLMHVRRHYMPHDLVLTLDGGGRPRAVPATPGVVSAPGLVVYRFGVGLFYANASRFTEEVLGLVETAEPPRWFVLLAEAIDDVDYTGGKTLLEVADQLAGRGVVLAVAEAGDAVVRELEQFGVVAAIGRQHLYPTLDDALTAFRADETGRTAS
ncbi:SulP family inorganic anion transporter [Cellulomonas sp.]|uniref:SulP family inorganic anion transporter n=1 Tax=Cellulomonas sp. TaxID=40001 RepID=UPI001B1328CA|nr:SulP family inorganic anion transporter [Cellulomonas sp.]MBO9553347.1 SulP family inorganic anion transporter [Cellulomonas sp.]